MDFTVSEMFGDYMVLQRDKPVKIWGTAEPGSSIKVMVQNTYAQTQTDPEGRWKLSFGPLSASEEEQLKVINGNSEIVFKNVAVGEVWLAGGQSNMEFFMAYDKDYEEEKKVCSNKNIRFYDYPKISCEEAKKRRDYSQFGFWRPCDPENLPYYSAVGYYFARELQRSLQVPVGIIGCNYGGTPACCWMDEKTAEKYGKLWIKDYEDGLKEIPDLKKGEEAYFKSTHFDPSKPFQNPVDVQIMKGLPLEQLLEIYKKQGEEEPVQYVGPWHQYRPCGIYHTMLRQAAPYTLKGFLYYQGESDETHPEIYGDMLKGLIECWRRDWEEDLPFLMAQLAPLGEAIPNGGKYFPELRRQQEKAAKETEKVYVASIGDVGSSYDIHPKEKRPVGVRLALLARGHVYGQKILCEAPVPGKCEMTGREIEITFQNTEGGLLLKGEKINALKILGENGEEVKNWEFSIGENTLHIKLPCEIKSPFFISFAQTPYYEVNLYNQADIPAKPFQLTF